MIYIWWYVTWSLTLAGLGSLIIGWGTLAQARSGKTPAVHTYARSMVIGAPLALVSGLLWLCGMEQWIRSHGFLLSLAISLPTALVLAIVGASLTSRRTQMTRTATACVFAAAGVYAMPLLLW